MKNAVTKSLDDPVLESMPVIPTDKMETGAIQADTTDPRPYHTSPAQIARNWRSPRSIS